MGKQIQEQKKPKPRPQGEIDKRSPSGGKEHKN